MQKGTHLECAYRAGSVCGLRDLDGMAIAFTRIERRDPPLIQRRESDLRVNSSAPHVKRTARLPSPVKSSSRNVGEIEIPNCTSGPGVADSRLNTLAQTNYHSSFFGYNYPADHTFRKAKISISFGSCH
jgi:hypothetical protein